MKPLQSQTLACFKKQVKVVLCIEEKVLFDERLTVEKLEEILEEKLRKVIQPLSKQIEDAMQSVNALNSKYDQIANIKHYWKLLTELTV